jgi:hypothetical protein
MFAGCYGAAPTGGGHALMVGGYDTGMDLLIEAAQLLELASGNCEAEEDADRFSELAGRVRRYLALSRPTTTLGMPRVPSSSTELTHEGVVHRTGQSQQSHIRVLPD